MSAPSRPIYRLRLYQGAEVLEEAVCIRSPVVPLEALVRELRAVAPPGARVEVVELDPKTGAPKLLTAVDRALDELLGDLR